MVKDIHFLHFSIILWFVSGVVAVGVSLITKPVPEGSLHRLTYWTRRSSKVRVELDKGDEIHKAQVNRWIKGE